VNERGNDTHGKASFWSSGSGVALCLVTVAAALVLIIDHREHALQWLPYALLLACPLLHVFTHGVHRGHSGHATRKESSPKPKDPGAPSE
jgi:hypothetical protein